MVDCLWQRDDLHLVGEELGELTLYGQVHLDENYMLYPEHTVSQ